MALGSEVEPWGLRWRRRQRAESPQGEGITWLGHYFLRKAQWGLGARGFPPSEGSFWNLQQLKMLGPEGAGWLPQFLTRRKNLGRSIKKLYIIKLMDYGNLSSIWISHKNKCPLPEEKSGNRTVSLCFWPRLGCSPASFLTLRKLFLLLA